MTPVANSGKHSIGLEIGKHMPFLCQSQMVFAGVIIDKSKVELGFLWKNSAPEYAYSYEAFSIDFFDG